MRPCSASTGICATFPYTSRPRCPGTVARGNPGSSAKGSARASSSESAKPPRPDPSTTVALYRGAFDRANRQERIADAVDRARREVIQALRAPLWVLGTLGAVMPFVGLFGTVVGILGSFRQISLTGQSGFAVVAPAISEALITTAGGIAVAVEAVILFNVFQARISREAFDLTLRADELTEVVMDHAGEISAAMQAPRSAPAPHPEARAAVAQGHA